MLNRGLVLVAGAAGSGKSTTLAAMIKYRSQHASGHILTIEDPIEFLFSHDKSIVDQREVGIDTLSFAEALRNALREAPDVIMLGEIRDLETARHAIAYAETGHLCISTLHAANASQAVERMVGLFPDEAHPRVRQDLSLHLKGIISQMLIPALHGGRVLAVEVLLQTTYISDLIQRGLFNEIRAEMAKGNEHGMMTFDQCLFDNYKAGRISAEQAVAHADSVANLKLKIRLSAHHSTADAPPGLAMNDMPLKNF
jgi:twitching motility protein PilU